MHNELIIPVKVASSDTHYLHLDILDAINACPQCARGEGCGTRPWFRGFFCDTRIILPHSNDGFWQPGDRGTLHIPTVLLHQLILHVYGWPLFMFINMIFLLRHCTESLQLAGSIMVALLASFLSRCYAEHRLRCAMFLRPRGESSSIMLCPKSH